ncbi:MAG: glycosyltransferase family 4 protein [candidate division Zixibacteria bacterium]|nr:glycosyltransferase family 4 protein [candidate division Zixibacteria bacterium]
MGRYRVLHLRATNFYGGPERQLHYHAKAAANSEFDIILGSFAEKGRQPDLLDRAAVDAIAVHLFNVKSAYDTASIKLVRKYLVQSGIDILCTHDYRTNIIGYRAVRKTRARWIAFSRGWTRENLKVRFYHFADKIVLRFADRIVAVSHAQKRRLRRLLVSPGKISVVHNAVELDQFTGVDPVDLRRKFNLPRRAAVAVCAGRFSYEKGQQYLIQAAVEVVKSNPHFYCILFGDGPDLDRIRRLIKTGGGETNIICPGFEKNLIGCLKGADILVNPSLSEGLPNIVLEALAVGVPVVATAVGGVPEIIENGYNGYLVPARDSSALAEALLQVDDEQRRRRYVENGFERIREAFSFTLQMQKLSDIYRLVLSDGAAQND